MMMLDIPAETLHRPASPYNERITHFCRVLQQDYKMCSVMLIYPPFVIDKHGKKNAFDACVLIEKYEIMPKDKISTAWQNFICLLVSFSVAPSWTFNLSTALDLKLLKKNLNDVILNCPGHYLTLITLIFNP